MSIVDAPFVGVAVPEIFSPISKAYWQTDASVEDIAGRFSLKSVKEATKRSGPARLLGVCCKHCHKDLVVKNRAEAIMELSVSRNSSDKYQKVECSPCRRLNRERRQIERYRARMGELAAVKPPRAKAEAKAANAPSASKKEEFYASWEWRTVRMEVLKEQGRACQCCGSEPGMKTAAGAPVRICVDHIKPLSKFWHLRLDKSNLQILCDECNQGKGNWDQTDFRLPAAPDEWIVEDDISKELRDQLTDHTTGTLQ